MTYASACRHAVPRGVERCTQCSMFEDCPSARVPTHATVTVTPQEPRAHAPARETPPDEVSPLAVFLALTTFLLVCAGISHYL